MLTYVAACLPACPRGGRRFTACCIRGGKTGDCAVVRRAREHGHELATHTKTHLKG